MLFKVKCIIFILCIIIVKSCALEMVLVLNFETLIRDKHFFNYKESNCVLSKVLNDIYRKRSLRLR